MSTNLRNCRLADDSVVDISIVNGKIKSIGSVEDAEREIDIEGKLVIPGIIDGHVHFREPGAAYKEDWLSGSRAAVAGGVTTVIDMPNNSPSIIDQRTLDQKRKLAEKSIVNYGFYLGATKNNLAAIQEATNIAGVKIFMGASTGDLLVSEDEAIKSLFGLPNIQWLVHAEDEEVITENKITHAQKTDPSVHSKIRSREAVSAAVERLVALVKKTNAKVHICHISTPEEIKLIQKAKAARLPITCEVSPHHLFLNTGAYEKSGNFVKVNPPLRTEKDNEALWKALRSGIIDTVATDHAPHMIDEKSREYEQAPAGIPEVQTSLPLMLNAMYEGRITLQQLITRMANTPAMLYQIKKRGFIKKGFYADLTVIDTDAVKIVSKKDIKSKCEWSPYEGWELRGWPIMTFINGNLVYNKGVIHNKFQGKELTYGTV